MALFSWAISMPALAAAFATLLFGKLSDVYGRRLLLLVSLGLYLGRGLLSALSWHFAFFIAARMILSLGQGALASSVLHPSAISMNRWHAAAGAACSRFPAGIAAIIGPTMVGMITDQA